MAADVVYVGCKSPTGYVLNLTKYEIMDEKSGSVRRIGNDLATVTLKGNAFKQGTPDISINGYVFTPVPKDFWTAWIADHADFAPLRDGFIIVANTENAGHAMAKERAKEPGQSERLKEADPRTRSLGVETADEQPTPIAA